MEIQTILLAGVDPEVQAVLRKEFREAPFSVLPGIGVDERELRRMSAAVGVVSIGANRAAAFRVINALAGAGTRVVVVGPAKDADLILQAMREGAREYLVAGETEKLVAALREQLQPQGASGLGSVTAVFPAKGGVGATSIAVNLAGSLAKRGDRVCLVDLDLAMGDVLSFLDLSGGFAISDVIANVRRLDRELLDSSVPRHSSGVHVLAQTDRTGEAAALSPLDLAGLVQFLQQHYQAVILDGLRTVDGHAEAVLDRCDHILLVATQEVPAVRRAQRFVGLLRRLGHDEDRVRLVLNRYAKGAEVGNKLITDTVGLPVSATVSSDYPALIRAINRGRLLVEAAPGSPIVRDIEAIEALVGYRPKGRPTLLQRLFAPKAASHAT